MPRGRKKKSGIDTKDLSKGQHRKLNALRKSLGDKIADRAFAAWMENQPSGGEAADKNTVRIIEALEPLIENGRLRIPRGGYIVRRGRGRVIIERPEAE
jgi:hypothetical protein